MSWLIAQIWILLLVAFVLGSAAAWLLHRLVRTPARGARR
jgi:peptidoglycan/LPS O-acetylase OafA/YrhL